MKQEKERGVRFDTFRQLGKMVTHFPLFLSISVMTFLCERVIIIEED